ncbi:unnamed protein product [Protopolystoma xenopodis]|uniref:Uncharacterized protein n=1 Tax=Protopolystoma xenopodis TaxID=117903 RepID=A0A3S5A1A8_9PLAT|nr:unnamed protein product [Protopolystoma xenopodis]
MNRLREYLNEENSNEGRFHSVWQNATYAADQAGSSSSLANSSGLAECHSLSTSVPGIIPTGSASSTASAASSPLAGKEIIEVEGCGQFHRIWSAVQFVFSTPFGQNEYTVEEMFGEGLNWAGCTLILLLGQQRRFEALDIGGQLLRAQRADKKDSTSEGVVRCV